MFRALACLPVLLELLAAQTPDWRPAHIAQPSRSPAMIYDALRQRVVRFDALGIWEWDGSLWSHRVATGGPVARTASAAAFDLVRSTTVLFGGMDLQGMLGDTWVWSGTAWSQRSAAAAPGARRDHAMAYDLVRGRVILFGGASNNMLMGDTWEWDGTAWLLRSSTGPAARAHHAMAFDVARQRTVLFGGGAFADTWEWDGSSWTQRTTANSPLLRYVPEMAYDILRQRTVMYGGGFPYSTETWELDGSDWHLRVSANNPGPRGEHAMAYDSARGRIVLFGGVVGGDRPLMDTWEWDGTDWTRREDARAPRGRTWFPLAFDPVRACVVSFGGREHNGIGTWLAETWEWDGRAWTEVSVSVTPPARSLHAMAFDTSRRDVLLFGGLGSANNPLADTWSWNGTQWTQQLPAASPPARHGHAMASDSGRNRVVLWGGFANYNTPLDDTWEWDGVNWTRMSPSNVPPGRGEHAMAYDPLRGRTFMFGGAQDSWVGYYSIRMELSDLWAWDGTNWTLLPAAPLHGRSDHAMAFDSARQCLVVTGGAYWAVVNSNGVPVGSLPYAIGDTWEWDGGVWTRTGESPAYDLSAAYDSARQQLITALPNLYANNSLLTWVRSSNPLATATEFGNACGSNPPARLESSMPFLGNPALHLDLVSPAAGPCAFGMATASQIVPLGSGCEFLLAGPVVTWLAVTNAAGYSGRRLAVPAAASLRGVTVFAQALVFEPQSPVGVLMTSGLRLTIGD